MTTAPNIKPQRQILQLLTRGEEETAEGKGIDLEAVLAEADGLLAAEDS